MRGLTARARVVVVVMALFASVAAVVSGGSVGAQGPGVSDVRSGGVGLANSALRDAVAEFEVSGEVSIDAVGDLVLVSVRHGVGVDVSGVIEGLGGEVVAGFSEVTEAFVPIGSLEALEADPAVEYVFPAPRAELPTPPDLGDDVVMPAARGEHLSEMNITAWHVEGYRGRGVKIGIIDGFSTAAWDSAAAAFEVPAVPAGTFCQLGGEPCDIWSVFGPEVHGVAVAEVIHEGAPSAELYLASVATPGDHLAALDWFAANGVQIVNNSSTAVYDGPGNGTGPWAEVVEHAGSLGMAWFNSAGNSAGDDSYAPGNYWRARLRDADGDGWLEFNISGDEELGVTCGFVNGLRWSSVSADGFDDWSGDGTPTDLDLFLFDDITDVEGLDSYQSEEDFAAAIGAAKAVSVSDQAAGADPVENYNVGLVSAGCSSPSDVDFVRIGVWSLGDTDDDTVEFMTFSGPIEHWSNQYSASGPFSDTRAPGAMSVGAIDPPSGPYKAWYSSEGPTNDGRTKPDAHAPSGLANHTYGTFSGTSASSPAVAAAAALIIEAGLARAPHEVTGFLVDNALNLGDPTMLVLPDPPTLSIGFLRVVTDPAVPSTIEVNGTHRDPWGLNWLKLTPREYTVEFTDVPGFTTPAPQTVTVVEGQTTTVVGEFVENGWLRVSTEPAVASTIFVDGVPRNDYGVWTDLLPGIYEVCFGGVEGFDPPPCETVELIAGQTVDVTGVFTPDSSAPGPSEPFGWLRLTTEQPIPSQIVIDGIPRDTWGLNWLKLPPGDYEVHLTQVPGSGFGQFGRWMEFSDTTVSIQEGETTELAVETGILSYLRVVTRPAQPVTILVDGSPINEAGIWTGLPSSERYEVCLEVLRIPGLVNPACRDWFAWGDETLVAPYAVRALPGGAPFDRSYGNHAYDHQTGRIFAAGNDTVWAMFGDGTLIARTEVPGAADLTVLGDKLYVSTTDEVVDVWELDAGSLAVTDTFALPQEADGWPAGFDHIAVAGDRAWGVYKDARSSPEAFGRFDLSSGTFVHLPPLSFPFPLSSALASDDLQVIVDPTDSSVLFVRGRTGSDSALLVRAEASDTHVAAEADAPVAQGSQAPLLVTPDGATLITEDPSGSLRDFSTSDLAPAAEPYSMEEWYSSAIVGAALSADGSQLAVVRRGEREFLDGQIDELLVYPLGEAEPVFVTGLPVWDGDQVLDVDFGPGDGRLYVVFGDTSREDRYLLHTVWLP